VASCSGNVPVSPGGTYLPAAATERPSTCANAGGRWTAPGSRSPSGPLRGFVIAGSDHYSHALSAFTCTPTCGGVTPTPAIATFSPSDAVNVPGSAANANNAGANPLSERPDQPGPRMRVRRLCGTTGCSAQAPRSTRPGSGRHPAHLTDRRLTLRYRVHTVTSNRAGKTIFRK
jgi:hypothetical protein